MLLKRSFESESIRKERIAIREAQNRLKEMQQMKLNEIEVAGQECSPCKFIMISVLVIQCNIRSYQSQ